jgi:hypothetical protein
MITLTSADAKGGMVDVNIDNIVLIQRQHNVSGPDFTAVFLTGCPPYAVLETQAQIRDMMKLARAARRTEGLN